MAYVTSDTTSASEETESPADGTTSASEETESPADGTTSPSEERDHGRPCPQCGATTGHDTASTAVRTTGS
jgi:hypothetical protein